MAYVLGFIYADGSIYPSERGKYTTVMSTDKPIIFKIKKWLESGHTIREENPPGNRKQRFTLRIGNKELYESLKGLGLYPSKSLTVKLPNIPAKYFKDFLRGYFDGDGCVHIYRSKGIKQKIILRKLTVIFTSGSKKFLQELLAKLREKLELRQDKIYNSQRSFQLRLATKDSVEVFKFMYSNINPETMLGRKFKVFHEYFKLRPVRVDKKVENILVSTK